MRTSSSKKIRPEIRAHCKRIRESLVDHLEHQLSPEEHQTVDEHLKACPYCSAEQAALNRTLVLLGQRDLPDPGETFWIDLRYRVRQKVREDRAVSARRPLIPVRAWVPVVVVASLLVFLLLWWSSHPQPPAPGRPPLLAHLEQEGLRSLEGLSERQLSIEDLDLAQTPGDSLAELLVAITHPLETLEKLLVRKNMAQNPDLWETVVEEEFGPKLSLEAMIEGLTEEQLNELSTRLKNISG